MKHFSKKFILTITMTCFVFTYGYAPISAIANASQNTVIHINPSEELGTINPEIYGVNHRFNSHGNGMWNPETGDAYEKFSKAYDDASFKSLRYPGGTVANLFKWKESIGHIGQRTKVYSSINDAPTEIYFGLDEAAKFCETHNSSLIYMYIK